MSDESTSPQTLAILDLLNEPSNKPSASSLEPDNKVFSINQEQHTLFKTIASCMAQGMGVEEVAKFIGEEDTSKVRNLFKHSLVLEELKNLAHSDGALQAFENVLVGAQMDSLFALIRLRDNAKSETVQYNSAVKIIDLASKNPAQDLDNLPEDPRERAAELRRRLDKLSKNQI